ncbi:hypothetical protein [Cohnella soli]|uniref:Uncharacterized protein n=1 Tax=Cohnella soli TaxID=425005 RepID=A0ABW0HY81_9BACL
MEGDDYMVDILQFTRRYNEVWNEVELLAKAQTDFVISFTPSGVQAVLSNGWFTPSIEMKDDGSTISRIQVAAPAGPCSNLRPPYNSNSQPEAG